MTLSKLEYRKVEESKIVGNKSDEICRELAECTGVNKDDVQAVLNVLGLEASLSHRIYADRITGSTSFDNLSIDIVRVSTGSEQI